MATAGTITWGFTQRGYIIASITGVTNGNTSPTFNLNGYPYTSYQLSGTLGVGGSATWQGSNDQGTTWTNIGSAITALPGSGTLTPNSSTPYELYRLNVTAGDGTTSFNAAILASGTRG